MNLKDYIASLPRGGASELAEKLDVSPSFLSQMSTGRSPISPERANTIERLTDGAVTRQDLRPDDYWRIWPDLPTPVASEAAK